MAQELIGILDPLADKTPLEVLHWRRDFCRMCIREISGTDDPRKDDAIQHYQAQLASIDKQIEEITGEPPPVVVQLKTAVLFGKGGQLGE